MTLEAKRSHIERNRKAVMTAHDAEAAMPESPTFEPLRPFTDELPPVPAFDLKLLPEALRDWVEDISHRKDNAPIEYAAVGALVALGALVGNKVAIHPKRHDDWREVANVWGCIVGPVSWMKSPALQDAIKPLARLAMDARQAHREAMEEYSVAAEFQKVVFGAAAYAAREAVKKGDIAGAKRKLYEAKESDRPPPKCRRYLTNSATIEKLEMMLEESPSGILQFRDELTGWLKTMDRSDREPDRAWWLEAWRGVGSTNTDRVTRAAVFVPNLTVSVLGGIQPAKLLPCLVAQREGSGNDGLVERLQLMVYPDRPPFEYVDRWPDKAAKDRAYDVFLRVATIEEHGATSSDDIPTLHFSREGQEIFDAWYVGHKAREIPPFLEGHLGKYPSLMAKLALIFHVADADHATPVSAAAATRAAAWCELLEAHARRVYSLAYGDHTPARALLAKLGKLPDEFSASSFANKKWSCLTTPAGRAEALSELVARGYLAIVETPTDGRPLVTYYKRPDMPADTEGDD